MEALIDPTIAQNLSALAGFTVTSYYQIVNWIWNHLFTINSVYQLAWLLVAALLAWLAGRLAGHFLVKLPDNKYANPLATFFRSFIPDLFPLFFLLFIHLGNNLRIILEWKSPVLNLAISLVSALVFLRIIKKFWHHPLGFRLLSGVIWLFAILNIVGLRHTFIDFLDNNLLDLGAVKLSLLEITRTAIVLVVFMGLARRLVSTLESRFAKSGRFDRVGLALFSKSAKVLVVVIGAILALSLLGVKLGVFAVFGGALGVGVGIGLQKISSNLMSGFTLLMDRSVKPGDVIQLDDTFGTVTSMQTRFVSLRTLEGHEHLIPNEQLITQKVINWSYADRLIRVEVQVGVAYSTDLDLAMHLLEQAARQVERVVKDQPVKVMIGDFADSSVNLILWAWIADPESGILPVTSDIRKNIWQLFKQNNIEIPFPQRDVHIKDRV